MDDDFFFFCTFSSKVKDYSLLCLFLFFWNIKSKYGYSCVSCARTLWTKQTKTPFSVGYRLRVRVTSVYPLQHFMCEQEPVEVYCPAAFISSSIVHIWGC